MQQRHKKIVAAEANIIHKQQNEMSALRKKVESNMNARLKQREYEHNKYPPSSSNFLFRLLQRY